ncbi:MAG: iron-containing alcohol dehydrogenase [Flavobacterium sp.]
MLNFELYNPTHYIFGTETIEKVVEFVPKNAKILLAYGGGSIFKNGIHHKVTSALNGFEIIEFGGIESNPTFETLMQAVEVVKKEKITFILAVGGGSVIDGVKFISAATNFEGDAIEILRKRILFKDVSRVIPFGTILTLPATGSEMNSGAVVSIAATQEKLTLGGMALFPKFSICDPSVLVSLPKTQLQNGVVDAFTHVMEQYLTFPHDAILQDRISEGILQTLIEIGEKVVENPENKKYATNFIWCCTMALNGLIQKGVPSDWATHMIGHELTALYHIDHAKTLAIIAPQLYEVLFETKYEKLAQYGKRVWNISGNDDKIIAKEAIEKTKAFLKSMQMPLKLSECVENYEGTAEIIAKRFEERKWLALGEKQNVTPDKVREIVSLSY